MYVVRGAMELVAIKLDDCMSGVRGSIRASYSTPPPLTIPIALSVAYPSIPMGTPTTFTPPRSAMWTSLPSRRVLSSGVGMYPFGGKATVFLALD